MHHGLNTAMDWHRNILIDPVDIQDLLRESKRIAVLGARPERYPSKPAYYVPAYLVSIGLEILPVPIVDRDVPAILGRPIYPSLTAIPGSIDIVDVFRRPDDLPAHVDDILAKRPRAVWLQSGIRHDAVASQLAQAGIIVVQDRCLMIDYRSMRGEPEHPNI